MNIEISEMTEADISFAIQMTDIEKWGYLEEDFRRLIQLSPSGCFIARENQNYFGMITTISYEDFSFVGCLIVPEAHRGLGIGEKLMDHAIQHLLRSGKSTIELDGVFPAVSLYRRLGFRDKYLSQRFIRSPRKENFSTPNILWVADRTIIPYDHARTSLDRSSLLLDYMDAYNGNMAICRINEIICGFAVVRQRAGKVYAIGPLVADSAEIADELLRAVIARFGAYTIIAGVPQANPSTADLYLTHDFYHQPAVLRMYRGKRHNYEKYVFAIISPEKG